MLSLPLHKSYRLFRFMPKYLYLLLLSHLSHVQLCATPQMAATRLLHPWDSPGKNTGVGCHFLLQCMKVNSESEVSQSCLTLSDPMHCSLPGSSIHGIFQARILRLMLLNCKKVLPSCNFYFKTFQTCTKDRKT